MNIIYTHKILHYSSRKKIIHSTENKKYYAQTIPVVIKTLNQQRKKIIHSTENKKYYAETIPVVIKTLNQ